MEATLKEATSEVSDETLILAIQRSDVHALEMFYDRYRVVAYSLALRLLGSPPDAEDVVQEAFVNVWRSAGTYRPGRAAPRSWLLSIVHHRAIDKLRNRQSRPPQTLLDDDLPLKADQDVWRQVSSMLTGETVRDALEKLPVEQRETIELAYFSGYSQSQIAERMQVPLGTIKGRIRIGLHRLKTLLDGVETVGE